MSRTISKVLCTLLAIAAAIACAPAQAQQQGQPNELAADTVAFVNLIRQRLDACRESGDIGKADLRNAAFTAPQRPALTWNPKLAVVAAQHAQNMVRQQFFDHVDLQGRTVGRRATNAGYQWRIVGENLAAGHPDLAEAMRGWLQSVSHCRNLIDPRFTEIGLARVASNDEYGTYWVMVLGRPQASEQPAPRLPQVASNAAQLESRLLAALN